MAPWIEKSYKESFGDKYSITYCLLHLKLNFLKKSGFKPTIDARKKKTEDRFRNMWINEESEVDIELYKIACHFLSTHSIHIRNIASTQLSEMYNNVIIYKCKNAYYMLREKFQMIRNRSFSHF